MSTTDHVLTLPAPVDEALEGTAVERAHREGGEKIKTLRDAARFFFGKATPKIIAPALAGVVVLRAKEGDWSWHDLAMGAGILALEPFTEWAIHVYVLHIKPRKVGRFTLDLHAAKKHRYHHLHPTDPHTSFVPLRDMLSLGAAMVLIERSVAGTHGAFLTGVGVSLAMLLTYEWTHFLIHTAYKPKSAYYKYIWRAHRLHHYKNEHYWMGVTVHLADHVLGTFPDKSEVPNSPTARTLGVEVEA